MNGEALVRFTRDEVFPFFASVTESMGASFLAGARLSIDEPTVLTQVVGLVNGLGLDRADADTKGDLFEHVLRQVKQAGELGQFRTPRHIIRAVVAIRMPGDTVGAEPDLEARKKAGRALLALVGQKRAGDRVQP